MSFLWLTLIFAEFGRRLRCEFGCAACAADFATRVLFLVGLGLVRLQ